MAEKVCVSWVIRIGLGWENDCEKTGWKDFRVVKKDKEVLCWKEMVGFGEGERDEGKMIVEKE